ncbi:MAG: caspase family protein [Oscillatoria sp. SIO1A7]|nr:caspase family protein [Oscillatoria sp. SIO1A7]
MSKRVALLIGVSEYGEGIPSLSAPPNDVAAVERVLKDPKMGYFDEVTPVINPDVPTMQTAIERTFKNLAKNDLVLLFFSGHGITDDNNRLYLTTKGTAKDFYKATSVPASFIQDMSQECYAKRQVIILDCCYSGAFAEGWQAKSMGLDLQKELGAEGRVVLTSSSATQTSFQKEDAELSLYTQYWVEGIATGAADIDGDGKIYARELHEYAKDKVREARPKQKPEIISDKEGYNILLSLAPVNEPELLYSQVVEKYANDLYRQVVEKYASEGKISIRAQHILRIKRQELQISDERSDEIINEVLAPYRNYLENIELYKEIFSDTLEEEYPLSARLLKELQDLQDALGLEEKDVAEFKKDILRDRRLRETGFLRRFSQKTEDLEKKPGF